MGRVSADPFIHHMAVPIKQLQSSADDKISLIVYLGQMQLCGKICHGDGLHLGGVLYNEGHVIRQQPALRGRCLMQRVLRSDGQTVQRMGSILRHPLGGHIAVLIQQLQGSAGNEVPLIVYLGYTDLGGAVGGRQGNYGEAILLCCIFRQHIKEEGLVRQHIAAGCHYLHSLIASAILQLTGQFHNAAAVCVPGICAPPFQFLALRVDNLEADARCGDGLAGDSVHLHHLQVAVEPLVVDDIAVGLSVLVDFYGEGFHQPAALPARGLLHSIEAVGQVGRDGEAVLIDGELCLGVCRGSVIAPGRGEVDVEGGTHLRGLHLGGAGIRVLHDLDTARDHLLRYRGGIVAVDSLQCSVGRDVTDIHSGVDQVALRCLSLLNQQRTDGEGDLSHTVIKQIISGHFEGFVHNTNPPLFIGLESPSAGRRTAGLGLRCGGILPVIVPEGKFCTGQRRIAAGHLCR